MDNFREWLSDNLRYILLGAGVLVIIAGLFFGVRACSSAMKGDAAEVVDESTENNKGNDPSSPENSGESDEKNENLEVYTKKGIDSGEYVVYAQYDYVCTGIDTPVPALSQLYVKTESEGALKIYSKAEEDEKVQKYMDSLLKDEDVEKLVDQVQSDYTKVQEEDEELKEFLEGLGEESQSADEETMTAVEDANIRAEASSDSEVIGGVEAGGKVTRLSTEGDWVQIEYEGQTGYIYGELLE